MRCKCAGLRSLRAKSKTLCQRKIDPDQQKLKKRVTATREKVGQFHVFAVEVGFGMK